MTILISALAFILLFTLLVLIHEVGHYAVAKFFNVSVEEFGFGLPPKAKKMFRWKGTDFTLNWIPFGGFVRLKGENAATEAERRAKGSFASASVPARLAILLAGVAMNFILAIGLLTVGFSVGQWVPSWYMSMEDLSAAMDRGELTMKRAVYITNVLPESTAAEAGITKDTVLLAIDGQPVIDPKEVVNIQKEKETVRYTITKEQPNEIPHDVDVTLHDGKSGIEITGYAYDLIAPKRSIGTALRMSLDETVFMTQQTVMGLANLVETLVSKLHVPEGITGIVGIAVMTHGSVQHGFMSYLRLVALLSLSLAILNVLPLPALDGGRVMFVIIEAIIRRPLNRRFELLTNAIGFCFLISLIVVITFNDIIHLF